MRSSLAPLSSINPTCGRIPLPNRYADKADILRAFVAVPPHARSFAHRAAPNGGREPSRFLRCFAVQNFTSRNFIVEDRRNCHD